MRITTIIYLCDFGLRYSSGVAEFLYIYATKVTEHSSEIDKITLLHIGNFLFSFWEAQFYHFKGEQFSVHCLKRINVGLCAYGTIVDESSTSA